MIAYMPIYVILLHYYRSGDIHTYLATNNLITVNPPSQNVYPLNTPGPVLYGLGYVGCCNLIGVVQISNGARQLEYTVKTPR